MTSNSGKRARSKIGMWFFLFTELILFGGLFMLYSVFRWRYPQEFHNAALELDTVMGTINTAVLLTSSLTMAVSVSAMQKSQKKISMTFQALTVSLGIVFLFCKYLEWSSKIDHGIYPGSAELLSRSKGEILFFGLYYCMTGLHGVHVVIGAVLILVMLLFTARGIIDGGNSIKLENTGLYWHLVDIIWIYIFPLFYLIT